MALAFAAAGGHKASWNEDSFNVLHLGCGRKKWDAPRLLEYVGLQLPMDRQPHVLHVDAETSVDPDVVWELGSRSELTSDGHYDLIIAWHMLEHIAGHESWFRAWEQMYALLKPGGMLYAESPYYDSIWAWSDPTHVRALSEHSLVFFNQNSYRIEGSMISPYRIRADFKPVRMPGLEQGWKVITDETDKRNRMLRFAMSPIKPFRGWWED